MRHQLSSESLQAFEILLASHRGEYTGPPWVKITLSEKEYEALCSAVNTAELPFRHDYNADSQLLVLRMPESPIHNTFKSHLATLLANLVEQAISSAAARAPSEAAASNIRDIDELVSHHVELETSPSAAHELHGQKVPDISFCYGEEDHTPFIAEIGYSQKSQDLASLARRYIRKSGGAIRTVLTVDLEHHERAGRKHKDEDQIRAASSICLYRLGRRVVWDAVFRNEEGVEQAGELNLYLSDFIPEGSEGERLVGRQALEAIPITVPFQRLAKLLRKGERRQVVHDRTPEKASRAQKRKQVTFDWDLPRGYATQSPEISPDGQQSSKKRRLARATGAGGSESTRVTRSRSR